MEQTQLLQLLLFNNDKSNHIVRLGNKELIKATVAIVAFIQTASSHCDSISYASLFAKIQ
jgi:hypothetical protein